MRGKDNFMNIIEVKNLVKNYGNTQAVQGTSFEIAEGEIFGLLGPNGAGKTTTLEMLEGLKKADSGSIRIFGLDIEKNLQEIRKQVGIVLQSSGFFADVTLRELLELFASFYSACPALVEKNIERFDLQKIQDKRFLELSGGQRQRFVLATALVHEPKVLFLDEPTIGMDPAVRQKFWDIILKLRKQGVTILITTHYMDEAEILCDRVGIIDHGKIVVCDRPVKLVNSLGVVSRIKFMSSKPINVGELEGLSGVLVARRDRYSYDIETEKPEESLRDLLEWEKNYSGKIFNLQVRQATLEDVFLKLTGHSLRE